MIYVVIATTKQRRERLQKCIDAVRESSIPHSIVLYENADGGCVLATKKAIEGIHGEIFLLNDDMIIEPTCMERLKVVYDRKYPNKDGVCQPWEKCHVGQCPCSPFCHTDTIRPFLEDYNHYGWDSEFGEVLKMKNKYTIVADAILDHQHFTLNADVKIDETYQMNRLKLEHDQKLFRERSSNKFSHRFK